MIVTIDGPAGAGKSTVARLLAARLGFEVLDTGAMYRAVALAALRSGLDLTDQEGLARLLETLHLEMPRGQVLLNGEDVSEAIRTPAVTAASGPVADSKVVRRFLVGLQQAIATDRNMVCEGRDQGTIVFPHAPRKFFLVAKPEERARRRYLELVRRGDSVTIENVLRAQEERDRRDASRDLGPMVPAEDAVLVDSTRLDLREVVDYMEQEVRQWLNLQNPDPSSHTSGMSGGMG